MTRTSRNELIDVAAELLDRGGSSAVTLREVGHLAGVSRSAPYRHFADKEDLLAAVATGELARQLVVMNAARELGASREALRCVFRGYLDWARAYPARFKLVFGTWTKPNEALSRVATASRDLLVEIIAAGQASGHLPSGDAERLAALLHALAHGAADLALGDNLLARATQPQDLIEDQLDYLAQAAQARRIAPPR